MLLGKDVYPYECMDVWERFYEKTLPEKEEFYSNLNLDDITDVDYALAKRVYKDFEIRKLAEYHDFYLKSDVLLLAGVFENFRRMYLEMYELDPATFVSAPSLACQATLKETQVKLDLITDIGMLLMIEKSIRGGIWNAVYRYAKANNKYMRDNDENKESSYINY